MTPNDSQLAIINSTSSNILVIAGAGSGKTSTIVQRIVRLLRDQIPPSQIVVITFTNAAADEVSTRINAAVGFSVSLAYVGTLHGYMLRLLQDCGAAIGFSGKISVLDQDGSLAFRKEIMSKINYKGSMESFVEAVDNFEGFSAGRTPTLVQVAAGSYYREMVKANTVDFDAILYFGYQVLRITGTPIDGGGYLFVDEYQDSGKWDEKIYRALKFTHKFFVGDPDQSIYAFRGGDVMNIMALRDEASTYFLEQNYRSDIKICQFAQNLIERNSYRIEKKTVPVSLKPGSVEIWRAFEKPGREIAAIAEDIISKGYPWHDCAVLCRTNEIASHARETLSNLGVVIAEKRQPEFVSGLKQCRALVSLLVNPENNFVYRKWVESVVDTKTANQFFLEASAQKKTMNQCGLNFRRDIPLSEIITVLNEQGIEQSAVEFTRAKIETLPQNATLIELAYALAQDDEEEITAGVTVTTMHGAKGREWPTVYVPCFEDEVIPGRRKDIDIEEDRRVAYVAITRAKHRLVISYCSERQGKWDKCAKPATPSRFIREMENREL